MNEQESSQEHKYHPAVEEVMETSGPDVGRIKDIESAKVVANRELRLRNAQYHDDHVAHYVEESNKHQIGLVAARNSLDKDEMASYIAEDAMIGSKSSEDPLLIEEIADAHQEAVRAKASYEQLQKDAKVPHLEEHNKYLQGQLDKTRKKIAESVPQSQTNSEEVKKDLDVARQTAEQFEADHPEAKEAIDAAKPKIADMITQANEYYEKRDPPSERHPTGFSSSSSSIEYPSSDSTKEAVFAYIHLLLGVPQAPEPKEKSLYSDTTLSSNGVFEVEVQRATGKYDPRLGPHPGGDWDNIRIRKVGDQPS